MSDLGVRLVKGTRAFDLNKAGECLTLRDFVPPATVETPLIAVGNAQNVGRGALVSKKAGVREWSFGVRLIGTSEGDMRLRAQALRGMLSSAGDEGEPLYVELRNSTDIPVPLWGQFGAPLLYEVLSGSLELSGDYALGTRRKRAIVATVRLTIQPYAIGSAQRLCAAAGGIVEDTIGTADGISRGIIVPEATTNKMTNPVFGSSTWNGNWTKGTSLTEAQNTDDNWLIPGTLNSARLTSAAASNNTYTQSINVGNTNKHSLTCYARLVDSGVISSTQLQLYYSTALTTTFTALGNGWYLLKSENFNGINAATATGVVVNNGYTIYITGFQLEEKVYCTPVGWGDLLGWAWSSTPHASTSSRTAATCALAISRDTMLVGAGTVRIVWRTPVSNTHPNNLYLFSSGAAAILAYFNATDDKFYLTDGTNTVSTAAQTFNAGDVIVLHCVWGAAQLAIYKNGVSVASGASFTAPTLGTALYFGTTAAGASNALATFTAATFDHALSQAEVTADYSDIAPVAAAGRRVESVPWLWTSGGDNVVGNRNDGSGKNWFVCAGVPGNSEAITEFSIVLSSTIATIKALWLSRLALSEFALPDNFIYRDASGTADANSVGGQYLTQTVDTGWVELGPAFNNARLFKLLLGQEYYVFMRLQDNGSNLLSASRYNVSAGDEVVTDFKPLATTAAFRLLKTPPGILPSKYSLMLAAASNASIGFILKRSTGSASVFLDYYAFMFRPLIGISGAGLISGDTGIVYRGEQAMNYTPSTNAAYCNLVMSGDRIELQPNKFNLMMQVLGAVSTNDPVITYTATYGIEITPRWALV